MPSAYLANVKGTGSGGDPPDPFRPDIPDGSDFAALMIDVAKGRCLILSPNDAISVVGAMLLATGATWELLRSAAKQTSPNNPRRNQINTWLTGAGYQPITAGMTWEAVVHFIARQVNPGADLALTYVGGDG